jgi:hypothetical protein
VPLVLWRVRTLLGFDRPCGGYDSRGSGDSGVRFILEYVNWKCVEEFVGEDEGGGSLLCSLSALDGRAVPST